MTSDDLKAIEDRMRASMRPRHGASDDKLNPAEGDTQRLLQ